MNYKEKNHNKNITHKYNTELLGKKVKSTNFEGERIAHKIEDKYYIKMKNKSNINTKEKKETSKKNNKNTSLPIYTKENEILEEINKNRVIIISGNTGCGKSTQVPQMIYDTFPKSKILITQPRRIAAISIAKRLAFERNEKLGNLIGYHVSMMKEYSKDTKIFVKTTGIFLEELFHNILNYTHIIIDEVHERDVFVDLVLALLKQYIEEFKKNLDIKLILMSATICETDFAKYLKDINNNKDIPIIRIEEKWHIVKNYFIDDIINNLLDDNTNINLKLKKKIKDKKSNCLSLSLENPYYSDFLFPIVAGIIEKIEKEILYSKSGVLIFIPGLAEIQDLQDYLINYFLDNEKLKFFILHSQIADEEQKEVFKENPKIRKIILATNIAESSITISNIDYIIDFCLVKQTKFDEIRNTTMLELKWCSKASCHQRKGRTGRINDGEYFQLITKELYNQLNENQDPEILRTPLDIPILNLKIYDPQAEPEVILLKTMNPPSQDIIINTIFRLEKMGALTNIDFSQINVRNKEEYVDIIDKNGTIKRKKIIKNEKIKYSSGRITKVGKIFADLPIDIKYSRLIILSYALGQIDIGISLAAILSQERSLFLNSYKCNRVSLYNAKNVNCFGKNCDFIACYTAYKKWCLTYKDILYRIKNFDLKLLKVERQKYNEIQKNTKENILDLSVIKEILILENELKKRLATNGMYSKYFEPFGNDLKPLNFKNDGTEFILKIILGGTFYNQIFAPDYEDFQNVENDIYKNENSNNIQKQEELFTIRLSNISTDKKDQLIEMFEAIIKSDNGKIKKIEYDKYSELITLKFSNIESIRKILFITSPAVRINNKIPIFRYIKKEEDEDSKEKTRNINIDKTELIQLSKEPDYLYKLKYYDIYFGGKIIIDKDSINLTHIISNYEELKKTKLITDRYSNLNFNINQKRAKLTSIMPLELMFDKYMMLIFGPKFEMIASEIDKNLFSLYNKFQAYEYAYCDNDSQNNPKGNIVRTHKIQLDYLITNYHLKIINKIRFMINKMINFRFESQSKNIELKEKEFEELKMLYKNSTNDILREIKNLFEAEKVKYFRKENYRQLYNYIQKYKREYINRKNNLNINNLYLNENDDKDIESDIAEEKENEEIYMGYINEINEMKEEIKEDDFLQFHEPLKLKGEFFYDDKKKRKIYIKEKKILDIYKEYSNLLKYMKNLAYSKEAWLICPCNNYNCDICCINQNIPKIIKGYENKGVHIIDCSMTYFLKPLKKSNKVIDKEKIEQFKKKLRKNSIEYDDLLCCATGNSIIGYIKSNQKYIYYNSNLYVRYPNLEFEKIDQLEYINNFKNIKKKVEEIMKEKNTKEFKNKIFCKLCKFKVEEDLKEFSHHLRSEEHKKNMLELNKEFIV